jgi:FkbM family methyltransferase
MLPGCRFLQEVLALERLSAVVDVGANPIEGDPPYAGMLQAGLCTVVGFEPQPEALAALNEKKGPLETYLPDAVGDGHTHILKIASASGMTSCLEPDPAQLALFNRFTDWGRVLKRVPLATTPLDNIAAITHMDMLKIDVQGFELVVFSGAPARLAGAVIVHTEVSFVPLYHDQPTLGDVDHELRRLGFILHAMASIKRWPIAPVTYDGDPNKAMHQLLDGDLVYVRDFTNPYTMTDDQVRHLALLAHCVYGSSDLTHRCLMIMTDRGLVPSHTPGEYLALAHPVPGVRGP